MSGPRARARKNARVRGAPPTDRSPPDGPASRLHRGALDLTPARAEPTAAAATTSHAATATHSSTHAQADTGVTVPLADALPGDLVFRYDDLSHVGVYIGNGMMIHSPKPGAYVREESVLHDGGPGVHGVVRPV